MSAGDQLAPDGHPGVIALEGRRADWMRRRMNTFRSMLQDTAELMAQISYASEADRSAARAQVEAINEVLTDDRKPV